LKPLFRKVVIIGVGLIGGSLGTVLVNRGLAGRVTGVDTDSANLDLALELEAIHDTSPTPEKAVTGADLVVVSVPVGITIDIIRRIAPFLEQGCIVTDVGSTKSRIVREAREVMPEGTYFVGGHPMTGSETAGVKGADKYLFENAVYILTPAPGTDREALAVVREMAGALGSNVIEMDPDEHDLMVAAVSHIPHLIATALVNTAGELQEDHKGLFLLAAGGFRDTTRIASGHPLMWKDICLTNKENILIVIDRFRAVLDRTAKLIAECDDKGLEIELANARELRRNIPSKMRGYLPLVHEIVVTVPDKPGVIANLAGSLGDENININDIEILRVREGEGGTIRLALGSEDDVVRALEILKEKGITVKRK